MYSVIILRATKVVVNVCVEKEIKALLSAGQCLYNRLIRYQNALRSFEEIGAEMQQDYQSDNSVRLKRTRGIARGEKEPKVW